MNYNPRKLWEPSPGFKASSNLTGYLSWLHDQRGLQFDDYQEVWEWSVNDLDGFWSSLWEYFSILHSGSPKSVRTDSPMPETKWFPGTRLNYAEHIFRNSTKSWPAIISKAEGKDSRELGWAELKAKTGQFQHFLLESGLQAGDRVAAFLPNIPEASIAFLATCASGGIWSSTSPDFGTSSVIDRFAQIKPKILIGVDGYTYGSKRYSRIQALEEIRRAIPSVEKVVLVNYEQEDPTEGPGDYVLWEEALNERPEGLDFHRVDFDHPIWILYSSGTTGLPKAITHSHGGVLLEHLKYLTFHNDVKPGERFFWFTTTGWMMWNYVHGSLLCGATIVLYDGSPASPDLGVLWQLCQDESINHFGTSAGFIIACMKANIHPGEGYDLKSLRSIGSTGSPLPPEGFDWIYENIKEDLWLASISGGTDVCSAFVGGNPLLPVYSGEIQCRALGCKLEAYDESGTNLTDQVGEMVISQPMPSMPIYFWGDSHFQRYRQSYFEMFPGVWRHGDWTSISPRGGVVIYGRSDSTLNRGGVRIGTSEIYRTLDRISQIRDSLIICLDLKDGEFNMPLFVAMAPGHPLDDELRALIRDRIRTENSPRHVPDEILEIQDVPYTISGKKVETPIKKILMGQEAGESINADALKNPESLEPFLEFRRKGYFG